MDRLSGGHLVQAPAESRALDWVKQGPVQPSLNYLQQRRPHHFSQNLFQCLTVLTVSNFYVIAQVLHVAFCSVACLPLKESAYILSVTTSLRY